MRNRYRSRTQKKEAISFHKDEVRQVRSMLSDHAKLRMSQRGIRIESVMCAMFYGSLFFSNQAQVMVIGRNEVQRCTYKIREHKGVHVIAANGVILTTFRNNQQQRRKN